MNDFEPERIYNNLIKMMNYRGVNLNDPPLSSEAFVQRINSNEVVTIVGNRLEDNIRGKATVIIFLIKPDSNYASRTADFKKLEKGFPKVTDGRKLEVIFISDQGLSNHIKKYLEQFRTSNPDISVEDHDYEKFTTEIPKRQDVPWHEIVSDDVDDFCRKYYLSKDSFGKIHQNDAMAIWIGLKPGMVVKIHRISETAGMARPYRICIK